MLLVLLIHTAIQWTIRAQHNLTPFGTASQSSRYVGSTPEGAILPPISNEFTLKTCSTTNVDGAPKAWWMFQFSFVSAFITDITIYYRDGSAHRMNGFKLYVTNTTTIPPDGFLCYDDPDPGLPNITQNIPCNQLGKYVIYYDTVGDVDTGPVVELCYVAINGCQKGTWGPNCTEACSSICVNQHCHPENGSCIWGCDPKRCVNGRCDIHTGFCTEGCVPGWVGQYCTCGKC
ncbi:angiopoietin-1 receptor-like [Mytilus edulis]|uniref:angiopoietin-1 receptor-like n=1 Tax=Mytilus edulis TaxID=6550 RepID=UPI0039EE3728